jgi:hypothetical protein
MKRILLLSAILFASTCSVFCGPSDTEGMVKLPNGQQIARTIYAENMPKIVMACVGWNKKFGSQPESLKLSVEIVCRILDDVIKSSNEEILRIVIVSARNMLYKTPNEIVPETACPVIGTSVPDVFPEYNRRIMDHLTTAELVKRVDETFIIFDDNLKAFVRAFLTNRQSKSETNIFKVISQHFTSPITDKTFCGEKIIIDLHKKALDKTYCYECIEHIHILRNNGLTDSLGNILDPKVITFLTSRKPFEY